MNSSLTSLSYVPHSLNSNPKRQQPLTTYLLPPAHSLDNNNLTYFGQEMSGVLQLAESLKVNSSLTSLSYVPPSLNSSPKRQQPLTPGLTLICRLCTNFLEAKGAKHVADAIATNTTLKELEYALRTPSLAVNSR